MNDLADTRLAPIADVAAYMREVGEAARAEERLAHDEQGPPVAEDLERLRDRAFFIVEAAPHRLPI